MAAVDRDQPWFAPWRAPWKASGSSLIAASDARVADAPPLVLRTSLTGPGRGLAESSRAEPGTVLAVPSGSGVRTVALLLGCGEHWDGR